MAEPNPVQELKLRIQLPACLGSKIEFVETHHTLQETISDVREALAATSVLNSLTNYSLVFNGVRVTEQFDDFASLGEALGDVSGDVKLELVERAYTLKDTYEHLVRFRENIGMNFFDHAARSEGVATGTSRLNSLGLKDINVESEEKSDENEAKETSKEPDAEDGKDAKETTPELAEDDKAAIKEIVKVLIEPVSSNLAGISSADSVLSKWKLPIKSLSLSQWNPVPQQQKLKGDLLYLTLTTLESETFSITCHASGFFVNRLSNANFNPAIKVNEKGVCHCEYVLLNLVKQLSPQFASTIDANKEALSGGSQFSETYLIPSQAPSSYPWLVSEEQISTQIVPDVSRSQVPLISGGVDGAELVKDWNDEFQGIKEFPRESFNERLLRDKLLNKYIQEFNQTAVSTAVEILKGNLVPLNPNESRDKHIFLRNNIFYSFGVNATGAHDQSGGDEAARYCFAKDLATVKLLNRIDLSGVFNLLTCIVDYLGERIICQAPVPGVFSDLTDENGEPVDKVAHGYSLEAGEIKKSSAFDEVLQPFAEAFHLKPHSVKLADGASGDDLTVSKDTKGIIGTDNRKYIIDLYRLTPLDIEFLDAHYDGSETSYPHREASIRHEAVEEWYKRKAAAIFKVETEKLEKEGKLDSAEKPQVAIPHDQITLNPDAFTGLDDSEEDKDTVRELSKLVKDHLIPEFLDDVAKNAVPYDGTQLSVYMHKNGINVRYLGEIAREAKAQIQKFESELAETVKANESLIAERAEKAKAEKDQKDDEKKDEEKKDEKDDEKKDETKEDAKEPSKAKLVPVVANMTALHRLAVQEMVARGVKHVLRKEGQAVPLLLKPHFVAHIHNCLLGQQVNASPEVDVDDSLKSLFSKSDLSFAALTPAQVVSLVEKEVFLRFRYTLPEQWVGSIKPVPMLREIAHKFGIQWKAQEYFFSREAFDAAAEKTATEEVVVKTSYKKKSKKKHHQQAPVVAAPAKKTSVFSADDIVNFVPVVRDSSYRCSFVDEIFETARHQIQDGDKNVGLALLSELVSFYQQIYGSVHLETTGFYSTLAQIYAESDMNAEASIVARKATILYERLTGVDSYETINSYSKASYYDSLHKDHTSAFVLNTQAFQDWNVVYGADHPNTVNTLLNFGTILQELKLFNEAKKFFEKAIDVSVQLNGELSDITGIIRHRFGISLVQTEKFKEALDQFKQAADIFNKVVGPDDVLSKECTGFATNLANYLAYNEHQLAEKRKQLAQQAKINTKAATKTVKAPAASKSKKKNVVADPEIASKSVDEILNFIEGNQAGKKKKKNKK